MKEFFVLFFLIMGAIFILIASIGLVKMPDVFLRMSASTIAATFGVSSMLIAVVIHFGSMSMMFHVAGVIIFLILTVPVGAHLMGRASHIIGLPMWDKTVKDDLKGKYNPKTHSFRNLNETPSENNDDNKNKNKKKCIRSQDFK